MRSRRRETCRTVAVTATCVLVAASVFGLAGCNPDTENGSASHTPAIPPGLVPNLTHADARPPAVPFDATTPRVSTRALRKVPHDTGAYTQGLLLLGGRLLESVGRVGLSDVREVNRQTGSITRRVAIPPADFGEGLAELGGRLYQLTWNTGHGFVYDAASLARTDSFTYSGEGWGLTSDGHSLWMSDGSSEIRVVDPNGFRVLRTIQVREAGQPVWMLNELEWVRGEIWANIYETDLVARIDPASGTIVGWIDLSGLLSANESRDVAARGGVANGIAFDSAHSRVIVTGKLWPWMFEVEVPGSGLVTPRVGRASRSAR